MSVRSISPASFVSGNGMLESGSGLAPVASLPCCFHRDASRSERPMKFEGFGLTDLRDELDIADVVMEQRSARCLQRVTLRPSLSIYQGSIVGPVLPHELTFYAVRLSKFVVSAIPPWDRR